MGLKKKDNQFCRLFKKGDGNLEIIHTSILIYTHGCYLWCYLHFAFFYLSFKFSTINNYYFCNKFLKKKKELIKAEDSKAESFGVITAGSAKKEEI